MTAITSSVVAATSSDLDEFGPVIEMVSTGVTAQVEAILVSSANKSDKIRQLLAVGCKRGEVAKLLGIRYQHVRNVEITPIKRK